MDYSEILKKECDKAGITEIRYSPGNYGRASWEKGWIKVPQPKTLNTLATALHEVGHIVMGKVKPTYYSEFLAEMFVRQKFKEYGLTLKRKIARKQRDYVAYRVRLSVKRATRKDYKVNSEVLRFIGAKQPKIKEGVQ